MSKLERRCIPAELRAVKTDGGKSQIQGYAIVFDSKSVNLGGFREVIKPEAFDAVLNSDQDIVATANHQPTKVLGRMSNNTLELKKDGKGIFATITPPDTQAGRDAITEVEGGYVDGMSFQFIVKDQKFVRQTDGSVVREVRSANLIELGPVTFPAYHDTTTNTVSVEARSAVEALQREAAETEETPETSGETVEASADTEEQEAQPSPKIGLLMKELDLLELE
jgi:hypothetical protein